MIKKIIILKLFSSNSLKIDAAIQPPINPSFFIHPSLLIHAPLQGVVFDIPSSKEDSFMEEWNRHFPSLKLSIPATLPSIEQNHRPYGSDTDRRRYSNENRNFFGASNGGYASRRRHAGHYADDARNDFYSSGRGSYRGGGPRNRNHTYPGRFNLLEE